MKRQTPGFLVMINAKRKKKEEQVIKGNKIVASAFLDIEKSNVEIMYVSQIYISVIRRLVDESRDKIKELTEWK